jgi:Flp pilus assembly pilin Flp
MNMLRAHQAQSIIEYAMIFAIVALAVTATYRYVNRSMNARLQQVQDQLAPRNK